MMTIHAIAFATIKRFLSLRPERSAGSSGKAPARPAVVDRFAAGIREINGSPVSVVSSVFRYGAVKKALRRNEAAIRSKNKMSFSFE
jgi:hypothetical protein